MNYPEPVASRTAKFSGRDWDRTGDCGAACALVSWALSARKGLAPVLVPGPTNDLNYVRASCSRPDMRLQD
jgi:hypothetical protein